MLRMILKTQPASRSLLQTRADEFFHGCLGSGGGLRISAWAILSLAWPDGHCETFEGKGEGTLTFPPRGDKGFGYDPIFIPDGYDITFGEMDPAAKHDMSHRADAFRQLVAACFS